MEDRRNGRLDAYKTECIGNGRNRRLEAWKEEGLGEEAAELELLGLELEN